MGPASKGLLFGTAGVPQSTPGTSTLAGIRQISRLELDCMEIEFVKGMKMGSDLAKKIREEATTKNVKLSIHAPYYVNLNSPEEGIRLARQCPIGRQDNTSLARQGGKTPIFYS